VRELLDGSPSPIEARFGGILALDTAALGRVSDHGHAHVVVLVHQALEEVRLRSERCRVCEILDRTSDV
jgi:hypothetical protein